jgi:hypothetical protein
MADDSPEKKGKAPVSPTRKRQDDKRERDLEEFNRQVEDGSLTIRKMTPKERRENPPKERPPKRRGSS